MTPKKRVRRLTQKQIAHADSQMLSRHAVQLSEHFTSVQITATKLQPDGSTTIFASGQGDLCARSKSSEVWLNLAEMQMRPS